MGFFNDFFFFKCGRGEEGGGKGGKKEELAAVLSRPRRGGEKREGKKEEGKGKRRRGQRGGHPARFGASRDGGGRANELEPSLLTPLYGREGAKVAKKIPIIFFFAPSSDARGPRGKWASTTS